MLGCAHFEAFRGPQEKGISVLEHGHDLCVRLGVSIPDRCLDHKFQECKHMHHWHHERVPREALQGPRLRLAAGTGTDNEMPHQRMTSMRVLRDVSVLKAVNRCRRGPR